MKFCPKCKKEFPKSIEFFYRRNRTKDGFRSWCKECAKKWKKENPEKVKKYYKKYYEKNRIEINKRMRNDYHNYKKNNPERHKKRIQQYTLKTRYGITYKEYIQLSKKQNNKCAICGCIEKVKHKNKIRELAVDHNHKTGEIRGLLCHACNNILGRAKDNPFVLIKCIKYLKLGGYFAKNNPKYYKN